LKSPKLFENLTIASNDTTHHITSDALADALRQIIQDHLPCTLQAIHADLFTDHIGNVYLNSQDNKVYILDMHLVSLIDTYNILKKGYMLKI